MIVLKLNFGYGSPWEGRAVTFVIGCGLGVLLRIFFVVVVVLVRRARGLSIKRRCGRRGRCCTRLVREEYADTEAIPPSSFHEVAIDEKAYLPTYSDVVSLEFECDPSALDENDKLDDSVVNSVGALKRIKEGDNHDVLVCWFRCE
jgi:hypothetical protein